MARMIDGDAVKRRILGIVETWEYQGRKYDALLLESVIEQIVDTQPTLTPPNEPLTLEQLREMDVEKVWRGEWVGVPSMGVYDTVCSKCGYCPGIRFWSSDFCPHCGAPMTDEAVHMVMERMEALYVERNDG